MAHLLLALLVLSLGLTMLRVSAADAPAGGTFEAQRDGDALLVNAKDAAQALGYEAKLVSDGELLTLCRETVCIPLRLSLTKHAVVEGRLHVDAAALAKAMHAAFKADGTKVTFTPGAGNAEGDEPAAYNAAWGTGRGFAKGETLPDLPFYDLEGNEARFGQFLGKRYVIYVWASW